MKLLHILTAMLLCYVGYWFLSDRDSSTAETTASERVTARIANPQVVADYHAYEESRQDRIKELAHMEAEQQARERAASKSFAARQELTIECRNAWLEVLTTNAPVFQALREKAGNSPKGETRCTICDGNGHSHSCVVCRHNSGVCVTCGGSGSVTLGETCPACMGTRKCYECLGTGKMVCPFCDDGAISARAPFPPRTMPVH